MKKIRKLQGMDKIRKQRKGKMKGKRKGRRRRMREMRTVGGETSETQRG